MQNYKKLAVWNESHKLVLQLYHLTKTFPKDERFGLTSQLRRSSISIPANLAEGCGRYSKNDTAHFFQIALGSLHESEYYLLLAKDLGYIDEREFNRLSDVFNNIRPMLFSLIKKIRPKII